MRYYLADLFNRCTTRKDYQCVGKRVHYAFDSIGDTLFIYFQGSEDIFKKGSFWDWFRNFLAFPFFKKPYKGMKKKFRVHVGFLNAWKEVQDVIVEKITEKKESNSTSSFINSLQQKNNSSQSQYKYKNIIIVGYSHGAALAAFCKECCWYYRNDIKQSTIGLAFESPRVYHGFFGVKRSVRERWDNFFVFRNRLDLVTHLPFWFTGWRHVGKLIKIGTQHTGLINDHKPRNVKLALEDYDEGMRII